MKYLHISIAATFLFCSCQKSNEDRAKDLITQEVNEMNKHDDSTAEIIEFGSLSPASIDYEITYPAFLLRKEMNSLIKDSQEKMDFLKKWESIVDIRADAKQVQEISQRVKALNDSIEHEKARFNFDSTRLEMPVKIKIINKGNTSKIETGSFFFDKDVIRIVGILNYVDGEPVYFGTDEE